MLDLEKIDDIIKEMGGIDKFTVFLPLPLEDLEKYSKEKILDKMVPFHYWRMKAGLIGNGVTTFYCYRTNPPFPLGLNIDEKVLVIKRAVDLLIKQKQEKRIRIRNPS